MASLSLLLLLCCLCVCCCIFSPCFPQWSICFHSLCVRRSRSISTVWTMNGCAVYMHCTYVRVHFSIDIIYLAIPSSTFLPALHPSPSSLPSLPPLPLSLLLSLPLSLPLSLLSPSPSCSLPPPSFLPSFPPLSMP